MIETLRTVEQQVSSATPVDTENSKAKLNETTEKIT